MKYVVNDGVSGVDCVHPHVRKCFQWEMMGLQPQS